MEWQRLISGAIALTYFGVGLFGSVGRPAGEVVWSLLFLLLLLALPLSLIWFADDWGGLPGARESHGKWRYTPPSIAQVGGWLLLLLPLLAALASGLAQ